MGPLKPVFLQTEKECGELFIYDNIWNKVSTKKGKTLKKYDGHTFDISIWDDKVMETLIE